MMYKKKRSVREMLICQHHWWVDNGRTRFMRQLLMNEIIQIVTPITWQINRRFIKRMNATKIVLALGIFFHFKLLPSFLRIIIFNTHSWLFVRRGWLTPCYLIKINLKILLVSPLKIHRRTHFLNNKYFELRVESVPASLRR
jgi:hypothetical protein